MTRWSVGMSEGPSSPTYFYAFIFLALILKKQEKYFSLSAYYSYSEQFITTSHTISTSPLPPPI